MSNIATACDLITALRKRHIWLSVHEATDILAELELSHASRVVSASGLFEAIKYCADYSTQPDVIDVSMAALRKCPI